MKTSRILMVIAALFIILQGCSAPQAVPVPATTATSGRPKKTYQDLVVGFAQIGAESEWRTADTDSIKQEADRLGVELKFMDAQQKQENQIIALRTFIAEKVDVIGIS
ncbi:MAG TPA: hypothetical protein VMC09_18410, partial [Anaerolineales bacterium]|nr:hypothetical protein [Anaerolineales bacterium]